MLRKRNLAMLGLLFLILVALPFVIENPYYLHILILAGICALPALGLTLFVGTTGQISLGHAAIYGIGAYTCALLMVRAGVPFIVSFICGGLTGCLVAGILGFIALGRTRGIYLAVVTYSFNAIVRMLMLNLVGLTGGPTGLAGIPSPRILGVSFGSPDKFYYLVLIIVALAYAAVLRITNSRTGNAFKAIANNEVAAKSLGIDVYGYKIMSLMISGFLAGLGGGLYGTFTSFISPNNFSSAQSSMFLSMAVIGGMGNIYGAFIGSLIVVVLPETFRAFQLYQQIFYGAAVILVLAFLPQGVAGVLLKPFSSKPSGFKGVRAWLSR